MSIEVKHLTHIYNPDTNMAKKALDDISVQFHDGEFIGLIGHTGSGKSSAMPIRTAERCMWLPGMQVMWRGMSQWPSITAAV